VARTAGALSTVVLGKTIVALARTANRENKLATESAQNAIEHAVRAGDALCKARDLCDAGQWGNFIDKEFDGSLRTAQKYMRLAKNWRKLTANAPRAALTSQRKAAQVLSSIVAGDGIPDLPGARKPRKLASEGATSASTEPATDTVREDVIRIADEFIAAVGRLVDELRVEAEVDFTVSYAIGELERARLDALHKLSAVLPGAIGSVISEGQTSVQEFSDGVA
jgi:hypothetical protein